MEGSAGGILHSVNLATYMSWERALGIENGGGKREGRVRNFHEETTL